MTETTVFSADQATTAAPVVAPVTTPEIPTELQEFVGTGKKYASVEAALKSVPHAQSHIHTLEGELAQAKAELSKRKTAEELLQDIQNGMQQQGTTTPKVDLSQDVVSEIVKNVILKEKAQEVANSNVDLVVNSFKESFGDKAEEIFIKLASDSGLTITQFNNLAATSPKAVMKLAGLEHKSSTTSKVTSSINPLAMTSQTTNKQELSARVPKGGRTVDVQSAWEVAKQIVANQNKG